jgi:glycerol-3-phosphate dehydrogenase
MKRQPDALDGEFDVLVVGGGITGAGVALDAATRGLRVALVDRDDFASATSSASSKLVHGGLRYLEQGALGLVYEALRERTRLLRNAPHLVRPLRFILPFYQGARVPRWKWRAGLFVYDVLAGWGNLQRSHLLPLKQLRAECPGLTFRGLLGAATFADAQMDDARLCLGVLQTSVASGAQVVNHLEVVRFQRQAGRVIGANLVDRLTGREHTVRSRVVVNATGPWADKLCALAGEQSGPALSPTKGVHVVAPGRGLRTAFLLLHPADGRVFFVIPWLGKTLLGTTDTECPVPPEQLVVTDEDVAYLLEGFNHHFAPPLEWADLLGSFAGVRPLVHSDHAVPSSRSREFHVRESVSGLVTVTGGKYTTYRAMAETITDRILRRLGQRRRCRTRDLKLDGAPDVPWETFAGRAVEHLQGSYALPEESAAHLVNRYGTRATDVAKYIAREPAGRQVVVAGEPDLQGELAYQRECEMACRPADFLLRRTRLGLFHPELLQRPW